MEHSQSVMSFGSSRMSLNNSTMSRQNLFIPAPKLCKVCKRGSFLKCFDCEVIYCSAKCQIKDWENHQYHHAENRCENRQTPRLGNARGLGRESLQNRLNAVRSEPVKPELGNKVESVSCNGKSSSTKKEVTQAKRSVNDRLNVSRSEPVKHEIEKTTTTVNSAAVMDVDSVCSDLSSVTLKNTPHPLASEESIVDQSMRKMIAVRKFKRHVSFDPEKAEPDGFYFVVVLTEESHPDGSLVYWVTPFEQKPKLDEYKAQLQAVYASDEIATIPMKEVHKFKPHLVMAKIGGSWSRAQILNVDEKGVVGVECIDSGEKAILVYTQNQLKVPQEPELMKSAFGIKVRFENIDKAGVVDPGDILKIRITTAVPYDVNIAEVQMQLEEVAMDDENGSEVVSVKSETAIRYTIDQLEVKELHEGNVKLLYCDGSKLEQGKLHVSESIKENWTLYDKLAEEIAAFIKENPAAGGYKPVVRELILAKFTDGFFYRAVCKNASDIDCKVHFIDYGSDQILPFEDVYQMPEKLMYTCVSHTVDFQLASGRSLSKINGEDTRQLLLDKNEFMAKVKKLSDNPRKYLIVIDDDLVVF